MFKFIKNLFSKEDWVLVDTLDAYWTYDGHRVGNCFYNIEFSAKQNKFRLICEGKDPKKHQISLISMK
jgi:hypothetical protein